MEGENRSQEYQPHPVPGWYRAERTDAIGYFDGHGWIAWRRLDAEGNWQPIPTPSASGSSSPQSSSPPTEPGGAEDRTRHVGTLPEASGRLDLLVDEPRPQARLTVLLRGPAALPHLIAVAVLGGAVALASILLWFSALLTRRVPQGVWRFCRRVLQWQARAHGYAFLLTDVYPPFALGDASYPVTMVLERPPATYRRASVLLRAVLGIPAAVVLLLLSPGAVLVAVVAWVATIVTGTTRRSWHAALAAYLRYELRVVAYWCLLTSTYPAEPLGDAGSGSPAQKVLFVPRAGRTWMAGGTIVAGLAVVLGLSMSMGVSTLGGGAAAVSHWNRFVQSVDRQAAVAQRAVGRCGATPGCTQTALEQETAALRSDVPLLNSVQLPSAQEQVQAAQIASLLREMGGVGNRLRATSGQSAGKLEGRLIPLAGRMEQLATAVGRELGGARPQP